MESFGIGDMFGMAWECAIKNMANALELELDWMYAENWQYIERVAERLDVRFDCNGEIVKGVLK